ncbi:MAG TPA: dienelactone hydrolase family protein [Desulfobacterales bacterium]|nr:dienelactone hydrolase family protein [Desulfobacterales bacterium]
MPTVFSSGICAINHIICPKKVAQSTYSEAPHAFTVFDSSRYREDADKKSWKRFTEFLAETLG